MKSESKWKTSHYRPVEKGTNRPRIFTILVACQQDRGYREKNTRERHATGHAKARSRAARLTRPNRRACSQATILVSRALGIFKETRRGSRKGSKERIRLIDIN